MIAHLTGTKPIPNYFNTCVIDSIIRCIANSDSLCEELFNYMNEKYTSDSIVLCEILMNQSKRKIKIKSKIVNDISFFEYFSDDLKGIIGAYMIIYYSNDKYRIDLLDRLRSHVIFLENKENFAELYEETEDEEYSSHSLSYQYKIYIEYLLALAKSNEIITFNQYTFITTDLINKLFKTIKYKHIDNVAYQNRFKSISKHLKTDNDIIFIFDTSYPNLDMKNILPKNVDNINGLYKCALTMYDDYICTDMILRQIPYGEVGGKHVVYYNVIENYMQDEDKVLYVPINKLQLFTHDKVNSAFKNDSVYYIPEILHYQKINKIKTAAVKAGFVLDASNNNVLDKMNILWRIRLIKTIMKNSKYHKILEKKHAKYIDDLSKVEEIYSHPLTEESKKELEKYEYNMIEM